MASKFAIRLAWLGLLVWPQGLLAASSEKSCVLPAGLDKEISSKYPGRKTVTLTDLNSDDRKFFQDGHVQCPGLVAVDFYGDGKPTFVPVLISMERRKRVAELVVAHQVKENWDIRSLGKAEASLPVVWRQAAGVYRDVYGKRTIRPKNAVIVLTEYESWSRHFS